MIECREAQFEEINVSARYKGIVRYQQEDLEFEYATENGNEVSSLVMGALG